MVFIKLLIFLALLVRLEARYSFYQSIDGQGSNSTFDCLYAVVFDSVTDYNLMYKINYNLIPYCRRLDPNKQHQESFVNSYENIQNNITFAELYRNGVTSAQLLDWSAPIDIVERYEQYGQHSSEIFHNCSTPWFGSMCQYQAFYPSLDSFSDLVISFFQNAVMQSSYIDSTNVTCYRFLTNCYRIPSKMCLDWREICDGNYDCLNGEDELYCQELEVSECSESEYRCHSGGQCIPSAFVRDGETSLDCLDGSDEIDVYDKYPLSPKRCILSPTFRCEEYKTRRSLYFQCGNGEIYDRRLPHFIPSCENKRGFYMTTILLNSLDYIPESNCRKVFYCLLQFYRTDYQTPLYTNDDCEGIVNNCSLKFFIWPEYPILYGFFQLVYFTNRSEIDFEKNLMSDFICFYANQCQALIYCNEDIGMKNGVHCCRTKVLTNHTVKYWTNLYDVLQDFIRQCSNIGTAKECSHPSLFHCSRSMKCISKHRLNDGENDCYYLEDELYPGCQLNDSWRFTCESETNKCLSMIAVEDGKKDCHQGEDEWNKYQRELSQGQIPIGVFCNGEIELELELELTKNSNDTDETDCEWWPCLNSYLRCDGIWHCLNGLDELNCPQSKCGLDEHICLRPVGTRYDCVPAFRLIEAYSNVDSVPPIRYVYMINDNQKYPSDYFLWNETKCITADYFSQSSVSIIKDDVCLIQTKIPPAHEILTVLRQNFNTNFVKCGFFKVDALKDQKRLFLIPSRLNNFPAISINNTIRKITQFNHDTTLKIIPQIHTWHCNRGIPVLFENTKTMRCLCPPSYFGDQCQWQNQRVSLTLQFIYRTPTYFLPVFQIIIMLINEQHEIASHVEHVIYIPKHDCGIKFNIYLLYLDQPKNSSANYSVHIDVFDKITLTYWASWHLSIPYQFLPVNRIATRLFIPTTKQLEESCPLSCGHHGRCMRYVNKNSSYFCQCNTGYTGSQCEIKQNCSCSSDAYCHASSMCICPLNKYGPKCYLKHPHCQSSNSTCQNDGVCVPLDDRMYQDGFKCLCNENFYGDRCENTKNRIDIELDEKLIENKTAILLHYIIAYENGKHQRTTVFKKIKYNENNITLVVTHPFHILMAEFLNRSYYLLVSRENFITSEYIKTALTPNEKCKYMDELLNTTILSYSRIRRIKYYPLLCRQYVNLTCFYDEHYICMCDMDRFSNCFTFDHSTAYNCQGYNDCENGGQCFQDNSTCPSISLCVCSDCYYGTKCQFSTNSFILSLDYILSYHIKPNISLSQQPAIVRISVIFTTIMFLFAFINAIVSLLTFSKDETRNVGCGVYLLLSSWISMSILIALVIKFWQLITYQMATLTNRSWINLNCLLLDMILQALLASNDWLNACISLERIFTILKGASFNKATSKILAKWITLIIILATFLTHIHMPFYRSLIDDIDTDEQRLWCLIRYPSSMSIFNQFINLFHFLVPFTINIISMVFIMITIARTRHNLQPRLTFRQHLEIQLRQNKHYLIATSILILLALPRLIISFVRGCMKSPRYSWLFLFGYLMSYLPSMMTFIAYILPSKLYLDSFKYAINRISQRIHLTVDKRLDFPNRLNFKSI